MLLRQLECSHLDTTIETTTKILKTALTIHISIFAPKTTKTTKIDFLSFSTAKFHIVCLLTKNEIINQVFI